LEDNFMEEMAGWIAPVATMAAAMMTAANLGTRVTGWGFVIFTIGSLAWIGVAMATQQPNLLWSNAFLTLVNVIGIWRWLGHRAHVEDAAKADVAQSCADGQEATLFTVAGLDGMPVRDEAGVMLAKAVAVMADCRTGHIDHLIVSVGGVGGVGETLRQLSWNAVRMRGQGLVTALDQGAIHGLPEARA
jgi:hypothetical protein